MVTARLEGYHEEQLGGTSDLDNVLAYQQATREREELTRNYDDLVLPCPQSQQFDCVRCIYSLSKRVCCSHKREHHSSYILSCISLGILIFQM